MNLAGASDEDWRLVLAQIAEPAVLESSARERRAPVRRRAVRDGESLLRLALVYGPGGQSLREASAWAEASGLARLSDVALMNRLRGAAAWLGWLCGERLGRAAEAAPARRIRVVDGTRIAGPGGRAWRLHLCCELPGGGLSHVELTDLRGAERLERTPVAAGELRIADRCYARPEALRELLAQGGDVLVRCSWKSLRLLAPEGGRFEPAALYAAAARDGAAEAPVPVGKARGPWSPFAMRLIALRKPPEAGERARAKARRAARRNGNRLDPRTLAACDHVLLLTSLPAESHPIAEIARLYRLRWQIELAIKRLKSILRIDRLPAKDPQLARTWLLAHLLFALAADAFRIEAADSPP
jgi:hypothetical protein